MGRHELGSQWLCCHQGTHTSPNAPTGKWHHWDLVIISSPFQTVTPTDFCTGAGVRRLNSDHMEFNAGGFRIKTPSEFWNPSTKHSEEHCYLMTSSFPESNQSRTRDLTIRLWTQGWGLSGAEICTGNVYPAFNTCKAKTSTLLRQLSNACNDFFTFIST